MAAEHDPLLLLRHAIAANRPPTPVTSKTNSEDGTTTSVPAASLASATHLQFTHPSRVAVPITAPTRFISNERPVDLRSVFFIFQHRESPITEVNASAAKLNEELATAAGLPPPGKATDGKAGTAAAESDENRIQNIPFLERADLIAWLDGSEESEFVKPLPGDRDAAGAGGVAPTKGAGGAPLSSAAAAAVAGVSRAGRGPVVMDPRLAVIYEGERKMGDRNSVLRGIKPTDFSHVRKLAAPFIQKKPTHPGATSLSNNPSLALNPKAPSRRPDPIILLSPSASSLLRMSNIRSFLENGRYVPPDSSAAAATATTGMLHVSRTMREIEPSRPMRFILVEGPDQFKPEYWNRLVAVFTTGQTWQFKSYKWPQPEKLFSHVLGVYVGWRGEALPPNVNSWGHRVATYGIDRWRDANGAGGPAAAEAARFRDKEVVESIWKAIEGGMRAKGWRRDAAPREI